ncbi:hypothetical protein CKA38_08600 [Ereboglobus luteus]|uniref:Uncharacterized protein n=2 Tax=Ereboglobus luteus TaxID=1796921 RepID=A0A2U8E347_9BACT|nr:hypothetical protein CKA38_08600 [Ereboglobus luteus]
MNILGQYLDDHEGRAAREEDADNRWMQERAGIDPEERLRRWDAWLRKTLAKTLRWPANADAALRLQCQCANELTRLVKQLRGRGWLLDGEALAGHVKACIAPIAEQQRAGKVGDFWPYFCAAVRRYVGANAEEIQFHARRTGADEGAQSMAAIMGALGIAGALKSKGKSLTELIADRQPAPKRPAKKPPCTPDAPRLPGL